MSYKLLKKVISYLRRTEVCPFCNKKFVEDAIFVLATAVNTGSDGCIAFLLVVCEPCKASAFVLIEATKKFTRKDFIRIQTKPTGKKVTTDDILDMHNFLKEYQGNMQELFKEI